MKNNSVIAFLAGAAIGAFVAWRATKQLYEKIAQEEIESVKEAYEFLRLKQEKNAEDIPVQDCATTNEKPDLIEYARIIADEGYSEEEYKQKPHVIPPEEFGENGYDEISLMFYADGVLADDSDEIVEDVENTVGDALSHFGEYDDDSVYVRCDRLQVDYEILRSERDYADVVKSRPYLLEDE